jgi:hypothetical protein
MSTSQDETSAAQNLAATQYAHRNDPDKVMSRLKTDLQQGASTFPKMHKGGKVKADGDYNLKAGEHVLTAAQKASLLKGLKSLAKPGKNASKKKV